MNDARRRVLRFILSSPLLAAPALLGPARALARPEFAIPLYERFIAVLRERGCVVATGEFGAIMQVELINDGPVTLWLER